MDTLIVQQFRDWDSNSKQLAHNALQALVAQATHYAITTND